MGSRTLGDIADVVMGQSPPGESVSPNQIGLPLLNGPTEYGPHNPYPKQYTRDPRKVAQPGDILFCVRGSTTGRMNWADQQYAIGRGVAAIRHKHLPELQPYIRALIEFSLKELLISATGSTFPNVSFSQLTGLVIPDIDEPAQIRISNILGTLDDKIELNRQINEKLELMARALFKSWFVDFDPVRWKMDGKDPCAPVAEGGLGLDPATAALFPDRLIPSPLGMIPEGWEVRSVSEFLEINPKRVLKKGADATYVDMKSVPTSGSRPTGWIKREFTSGMRFRNGDCLMARITPCLENGKTCYVDFLDDGEVGWGSTEFIVLHSKPGYPNHMSYLIARDPGFREHAIMAMTGSSGRQRVSNECFDDYMYAEAGESLYTTFDRIVSRLFDLISNNSGQIHTLQSARDALLPRLLAGEVGISK